MPSFESPTATGTTSPVVEAPRIQQPRVVPFENVTPFTVTDTSAVDGGSAFPKPAEAPVVQAEVTRSYTEPNPTPEVRVTQGASDSTGFLSVDATPGVSRTETRTVNPEGQSFTFSAESFSGSSPEVQAQAKRVEGVLSRLSGRAAEMAAAFASNPELKAKFDQARQSTETAGVLKKVGEWIKYQAEGLIKGKGFRDQRAFGEAVAKNQAEQKEILLQQADQLRLASMELAANPRLKDEIAELSEFAKGFGMPSSFTKEMLEDRFPGKADAYQKILSHPDAAEFFDKLNKLNLNPELAARMIDAKFSRPTQVPGSPAEKRDDSTEVAAEKSEDGSSEKAGEATEKTDKASASRGTEWLPNAELREQISKQEGSFEGNLSPAELYQAQIREFGRLNSLPAGVAIDGTTETLRRYGPDGKVSEETPLEFDYYVTSELQGKPEAILTARKDRAVQLSVAETLMLAHQGESQDKLADFETRLAEKFGSNAVTVNKVGADGAKITQWTPGMRVKTEYKNGKVDVTFEDAGDVQMSGKFESKSRLSL